MRYKHKGVTLAATAIAIVAWMFLGYISFIVMASPFSVLAAVRTARQAEQYAEFVANSLKLVDYSELGSAAHARRSLTGEISGAAGWESSIAMGAEQQIGSNPDNLQRIATIDIFQTGDTLSRYTLQVPLSSAGSGASEGGGDDLPVGTILPYQGNDSDIPEKWHLCDGSAGTPDLRDGRFLEGSSSAKNWHSAGLPNITGEGEITVLTDTSWQGTYNSLSSGAISPRISISENRAYFKASGTRKFTGNMGLKFDASKSNSTCASIYRNDVTTVQPKSYTVRYIMKIKA